MTRFTALPLLALATVLVSPLAAQNGREYFVPPDTTVDPAVVARQAPYAALRDSTSAISAAGARLMSGMSPSSSVPWMQSRARGVAQACEGAVAPLAAAREATEGAHWEKSAQQQAQATLLKEMSSFAGALSDCRKTWPQMAADTSQSSLRDQLPYRMQQLQNRVLSLNRSVQAYLKYVGMPLPLPGQAQS